MSGKRVKALFFLLVAAGCFQAKQLFRIQGLENEKWAAMAVKQRLEVVWTDKEEEVEIVALVDAYRQPIPGIGLKYRTSVTGRAPAGIKELFGQTISNSAAE